MIRKLALPVLIAGILASPFVPATLLNPARADESKPQIVEPQAPGTPGQAPAPKATYAECGETWMAPTSDQAAICRRDGWTIKRDLLVGPHGVVRHNQLQPCLTEDQPNPHRACFWNASKRGNCEGQSFWRTRAGKQHAIVRFAGDNGRISYPWSQMKRFKNLHRGC